MRTWEDQQALAGRGAEPLRDEEHAMMLRLLGGVLAQATVGGPLEPGSIEPVLLDGALSGRLLLHRPTGAWTIDIARLPDD
jgi:hypothetical protein